MVLLLLSNVHFVECAAAVIVATATVAAAACDVAAAAAATANCLAAFKSNYESMCGCGFAFPPSSRAPLQKKRNPPAQSYSALS